MDIRIHLRDRNSALVDEWKRAFEEIGHVQCSVGDIFHETEAEAIVSPANSFGKMDGGIDLVYSLFFGWDLEKRLMSYLAKHHYGELPVGMAVAISTGNGRFPTLISAPTMRVPCVVKDTANAYLAFRAALALAKEKGIKSILCPGLGTAVGQMPPDRCAKQMYEAYRVVVLDDQPIGASDIWRRHQKMTGYDGRPS